MKDPLEARKKRQAIAFLLKDKVMAAELIRLYASNADVKMQRRKLEKMQQGLTSPARLVKHRNTLQAIDLYRPKEGPVLRNMP